MSKKSLIEIALVGTLLFGGVKGCGYVRDTLSIQKGNSEISQIISNEKLSGLYFQTEVERVPQTNEILLKLRDYHKNKETR